ncbi:MAG: phenylalanine--tRNA ligase subunit alpha, partial [Myxococcota bacterium]
MDPERTLHEARRRILACEDADALKSVEREYVGKKGAVAAILASIPKLAPEQRKAQGQQANALKQAILAALAERQKAFDVSELDAARRADDFDPTLPPPSAERGSLHPITQVTRELEDLFVSMGYEVLDGPEVELDLYNFEALNITKDHPARDSQDTFYCDAGGHLVLRTHTSPVQVRAMEDREPPFRVIAPGRVFRQETTDASHDHTFYQMEGLVVGEDISVAHLIGAMKTLLR